MHQSRELTHLCVMCSTGPQAHSKGWCVVLIVQRDNIYNISDGVIKPGLGLLPYNVTPYSISFGSNPNALVPGSINII